MYAQFEKSLASFCAPTLAGIKPASLMACQKRQHPQIDAELAYYNRLLHQQQFCFERLFAYENHDLIFVYKTDLLLQHLQKPAITQLLLRHGYPLQRGLPGILAALKEKFRQQQGFPHEIGLFLGYPPEDVLGFIQHHGENYKCCGYWKVYSDVQRAQKIFQQYHRYKAYFCTSIQKGISIRETLSMA